MSVGRVRDFELLKFLGKGAFGAVYQARRAADKKTYAIKKVDTRRMPTKERVESVNEIRVLASISGPHVIGAPGHLPSAGSAACSHQLDRMHGPCTMQ